MTTKRFQGPRNQKVDVKRWLVVLMGIILLALSAKNASAASSSISLVSITIAPSTLAAPVGSSQQFTATATYSDGSTQNLTAQVTWNSSNTSVATVNASGLATVLAAGTASISASISASAMMTSQVPAGPAAPTTASTATSSQYPSGLILHWTFDSSTISGNRVTDTSGHNETGTISGNVAIVTGELGQALQFNGSNSLVENYAAAPFNGNLTLSAWINTTNSVRAEAILSRYDASGAGTGYIFRTDASGHLEIVLGGQNGGSIISPFVDTATVNDGNWHHVAAVITVGQGVQFYVDGNPTASVSGRVAAGDGGTFNVGVNPYTPFGNFFTGTIDEVQVYNGALSSSEVASVYSLSGGSQSASSTATTNAAQAVSTPSQPVVTPGQLTASPATLTFGSINIGSSASATVAISNTGGSSVTVSNVSVSGAGFNATGLPVGTVLSPGHAATVNVTFTPGGANSVAGGITITSNASDASDTISLSGVGTQPPPTVYSVDLSWAPSSTPGILGYDLYRGTVAGGPYTLLTTVPSTTVSYIDATAQVGQTYYYVVTSVAANNVQSAYSNVATAIVQ